MARIHPAYLEHERKRFMQPDAHRFLRPDWRRFVQPDSELAHYYAGLEAKYRPDQPRVPAGRREGGQWTDDEEGEDDKIPNGARLTQYKPANQTTELSAASRKRNGGHHYVPRAVFRDAKVSDEAKKVFEDAKTGKLYAPKINLWDAPHRRYNKAVADALDQYLKKNNILPEKMTAEQAKEFVRVIHKSSEPRVRDFNNTIRIREFMFRLLRGGGRE